MKECPGLLHDMAKMGMPHELTVEAGSFHPVIDALIRDGAE
jgi:hypothetical protein